MQTCQSMLLSTVAPDHILLPHADSPGIAPTQVDICHLPNHPVPSSSKENVLRSVRVRTQALCKSDDLLEGVHVLLRNRIHVIRVEGVAVPAVLPRPFHSASWNMGHVCAVPYLVAKCELGVEKLSFHVFLFHSKTSHLIERL